jgi:hypothetical protein
MKLIALTFAGRKRYMEILFQYIIKYKKYINEYHLYQEIDYIYDFQKNNHDFVKVIKLEDVVKFDRANVWNLSYRNCQDEDVIYLKIDDDIVFINQDNYLIDNGLIEEYKKLTIKYA